jgi:hypothetical protein
MAGWPLARGMVELEANLTVFAGLATLGLGIILAVVGAISARRMGSKKIAWVAAGFFLLGLQGGLFALGVRRNPVFSLEVLFPALVGLAALLTFYVAVYRRT